MFPSGDGPQGPDLGEPGGQHDPTSDAIAELLGAGYEVTIGQFGDGYLFTATGVRRLRAQAATPAGAVLLMREQAFPRGRS